MSELEAVQRYFGRPEFRRFLAQLERQYRSSTAGARGYVTLVSLSEEERRVLDEFYATYSVPVPNETKRYSIRKFEQQLLASRFALTVAELLTVLNGGESVRTRQEQQQLEEAEWAQVVTSALEESGLMLLADSIGDGDSVGSDGSSSGKCRCDSLSGSVSMNTSQNMSIGAARKGKAPLLRWVQGLLDGTSPGARTLRRVFARSPEEARHCLRHCLAALIEVIGQPDGSSPVRLPILSAEVTGDAHALDWKQPLGRLFWWGLTSVSGFLSGHAMEEEDAAVELAAELQDSQAIWIREGYRRGGVADDDVSSQVMLCAPGLFGECEERVLTLRQVERLTERTGVEMGLQQLYMVENPSVFAELVDALALRELRASLGAPAASGHVSSQASIVIICGNGQPTTAVLKLLDWLTSGHPDVRFHYAGDLDPSGLVIAQGLQRRYPEAFLPWHMDMEVYKKYVHRGMRMTEAERLRVQQSMCSWAEELSRVMADTGVKLHQELWVKSLIGDLV
ncbi:TIGR02679 domain-containing protein [Paenibacillus sp. YYML68]|uniref:TIGR02679 domain-containing protein n=1 Tax=Paenibacillus sp. YYML68 TaxID=2909250 RepID=UPI00249279F3|nr:TIGR02679 domain-containing protein [Paenibacillus sp. YYML68]